MPRRARPGDRAALEAALSPQLLAGLEALREVLDIQDWTRTPLGPPFQAAAAILEAAGLVRRGHSPSEALHAAAGRLGLSGETVRTRVRRWSEASRVQVGRAARRSTGVRLVEDAALDTEPEGEAA